MYHFENYTLVIYETSKEYHREVPEHRFVAYLREFPEASLHGYGESREAATENLRQQYDFLVRDAKKKKTALPSPANRDDESFSGKIVLRMPSWLHRQVAELAGEQDLSINSYIVNRLIKETTLDEVTSRIGSKQAELYERFIHEMSRERLGKGTAGKHVPSAKVGHLNEPKGKYEV